MKKTTAAVLLLTLMQSAYAESPTLTTEQKVQVASLVGILGGVCKGGISGTIIVTGSALALFNSTAVAKNIDESMGKDTKSLAQTAKAYLQKLASSVPSTSDSQADNNNHK